MSFWTRKERLARRGEVGGELEFQPEACAAATRPNSLDPQISGDKPECWERLRCLRNLDPWTRQTEEFTGCTPKPAASFYCKPPVPTLLVRPVTPTPFELVPKPDPDHDGTVFLEEVQDLDRTAQGCPKNPSAFLHFQSPHPLWRDPTWRVTVATTIKEVRQRLQYHPDTPYPE
eukprot:gb/GEZN01017959.1/.p1 GENE.gb/GEZN01017959.1/~~gb/GEZN01017959.1/.p1  ORF type:complete len:174 (-),score=7.84 gb/GEZN01017959.1/:168-689(-)